MEDNYKKSRAFSYNDFFVTDKESMDMVLDAIVVRGKLKTFRSNILKTKISGKKKTGVFFYFIDLGLLRVKSREATFLYERIFDLKDVEKIRKEISVESTLLKMLDENIEPQKYRKSALTDRGAFKVLYAYLRWNMKLHRPLRTKLFRTLEESELRNMVYKDCPLTRYQVVKAMQFAKKYDIINIIPKKTKGDIYYFNKDFLIKKIGVLDILPYLEDSEKEIGDNKNEIKDI